MHLYEYHDITSAVHKRGKDGKLVVVSDKKDDGEVEQQREAEGDVDNNTNSCDNKNPLQPAAPLTGLTDDPKVLDEQNPL